MFKIQPDALAALDALAVEQHTTRSELIRTAVEILTDRARLAAFAALQLVGYGADTPTTKEHPT